MTTGAEDDEKTYKSDPFYQCPYSESDIRRVGHLPADFMSAFSQLRSASDFRLHYLLSKYTFGEVCVCRSCFRLTLWLSYCLVV